MNRRQYKKLLKKVSYPLVDEFNLLTLNNEEYKQAMEDFHKYVQKHCRYKHYKDRYKNTGFSCYHFPVGKEYAERLTAAIFRTARKFPETIVVQDNRIVSMGYEEEDIDK